MVETSIQLRKPTRERAMNLAIPQDLAPYLKLGTCSWKYDSWRGLIYPSDAQDLSANYLVEYAKHLGTVEVDQWFWSLFPAGVKLPERSTVKAYAADVPDGFLFAIKAPNAITLTHFYSRQPKRYADYANQPNKHFLSLDLLKRFLDSLAPMDTKLGPIMFQFEYLNRKKMPSLQAFLDRLHEFLAKAPKGFRYAIETRNPNYLTEAFFDFLREHCLGYVFLEGYYMPPIGEVFAKHDPFTSGLCVIRLHGGDREGIEERTGKLWNEVVEPKPEGLDAAASIIRAGTSRSLLMLVYANNHFEGSAPLTLERLLGKLREEPLGPDEKGSRTAQGLSGRA